MRKIVLFVRNAKHFIYKFFPYGFKSVCAEIELLIYGFIITVIPPLLIGLFGRLVLKINYYTLMGFIGGSHTDPPTLAFANNIAPEGCKLPNTGYATVYPLTMFLRIFTAQLLVLFAV